VRDVQRIPLHYRLFRHIPTRVRLLLVYIGSPKMTVGASAIVWDLDGRVLLVRHTYRSPAWGFPSGLVGHREDPGTALERELGEELGVVATTDALLHAETHAPARHLTLYYQMTLQGTPRYDGIEIDAFQYAALDKVEAILGTQVGGWLWAARAAVGHG